MSEDAEINGMKAIAEVLKPFDAEAQVRMIEWIVRRYGIAVRGGALRATPANAQDSVDDTHFESLSDLFDSASPQTEAQMALVGGYWFQLAQRNADFSSQQVNDELKNLGHGLSNVTRAFDFLRDTKPAQVLQLQKSGKTKQARKKYKLTQAGIKAVTEMIRGHEGDK